MAKHGAYYFPTEKERELFWSDNSQEYRCIGHLRGYFSGDMFYHNWFQHSAEKNSERFKAEFYPLMDTMMDAEFKSMNNAFILYRCATPLGDGFLEERGVKLMTDHYVFYVRIPEYIRGNYIYIYCYEKEEC